MIKITKLGLAGSLILFFVLALSANNVSAQTITSPYHKDRNQLLKYIVNAPKQMNYLIGSNRQHWYQISTNINDQLDYATYFGNDTERIYDIATDVAGNIYLVGESGVIKSQLDLAGIKTTAGAFQVTPQGGGDIIVIKMNATATEIIYATYLGGSGPDHGYSLAVDNSGCVYITGQTSSLDFPTTPDAFLARLSSTANASFVTKLNAQGNDIVYSTFIAGNIYDDEVGYGIAVDNAGFAYVTGSTKSARFPTTAGAFITKAPERKFTDALNGFVLKLNTTGTNLVYSTYISGIDKKYSSKTALVEEVCYDIVIDSEGNAYITGRTSSFNLPVTEGVYQPKLNVGDNAFVIKLNATGTGLIFSTYLGGKTSGAIGHEIALDEKKNIYIVGTGSLNETIFPDHPLGGSNPNYLSFIAKLDSTASKLIYSTALMGYSHPLGKHLTVDRAGYAYVVGSTYIYKSGNDTYDTYQVRFDPQGNNARYKVITGSSSEIGNLITLNKDGAVIVGGLSDSSDFPITSDALQREHIEFAQIPFLARIDAVKPKINNVLVFDNRLSVLGEGFDQGSELLVNNQSYKVSSQIANRELSSIKALKKMAVGQPVTIQIRNPGGAISEPYTFTR